jgi:hypothetical protein
MPKRETIVSYSLEEVRELVARGEDRTDWAKVDAKSEAQLDADIASDPDAQIEEGGGVWVCVPPGYAVRLVKKSA